MKELGRVLRERRESLGIDLDEVQARTKIRKRYLAAIEDGDWSALPGDVYARGFVRSYAECVGLDGKVLLDQYAPPSPEQSAGAGVSTAQASSARSNSITRERQVARPSNRPQRGEPRWDGNRSRRQLGVPGEAVAIVAILAVIAGAWWLIGRPARHAPTPVGNLASGLPAGGTADNSSTNGGQNSTSVENSTGTNAGTAGNATSGSGPATTQPQQLQVVSQSFLNGQQTYVVSASGPLAVTLSTTSAACWVRVSADGSVVDGNDTVAAGSSRHWQANQSLSIRIGNVQAVSLTVNGQALGLPSVNTPIDVVITKAQQQ